MAAASMLTSVWRVALRCLAYVVVVLLSHEIACRTGVFENCYTDYWSIWLLALILSAGALATELVMVPILRFLKGVSLTRPWVVIFFYELAGFMVPTIWFALTSEASGPSVLSVPWFLAGASMGVVRSLYVVAP